MGDEPTIKLAMTLSIGFSNAEQSDVIDSQDPSTTRRDPMPRDEHFIAGEIHERERCMELARFLEAHLRKVGDPEADAWARALDWFRQRIKGGHLSIYAQQDFDRRFHTVDWTAFRPDSSSEED